MRALDDHLGARFRDAVKFLRERQDVSNVLKDVGEKNKIDRVVFERKFVRVARLEIEDDVYAVEVLRVNVDPAFRFWQNSSTAADVQRHSSRRVDVFRFLDFFDFHGVHFLRAAVLLNLFERVRSAIVKIERDGERHLRLVVSRVDVVVKIPEKCEQVLSSRDGVIEVDVSEKFSRVLGAV